VKEHKKEGRPVNKKLREVILSKYRFQGDFAYDLGITESRLSGIIRGHIVPTPYEKETMAEVLGVSEEELWED